MTNAPTSSDQISSRSGRFTVGIISLTALILIAYFLPSIFQGMLWIFLALIVVFGWLLIDAVIFGMVSHLAQQLPRPFQLTLAILCLVVAAIGLLVWWGGIK